MRTFFYTLGQGIRNLWRNKGYTLASIATIAACLFLFGLFYSVIYNIQHIVDNAQQDVSVTVFFKQGTTEDDIKKIQIAVKERPEVADVKYVSADEAWAEFSRENLGEYAEGFEENPLADSANLEIYLSDVSRQPELVSYLQGLDEVREVNYSEVAASTVSGANSLIGYASIAIIVILLVVAIFLISNTVATGIRNHEDEIRIMKYIGASDFFVRGPYVFEGLIIGLLGSVLPLVAIYELYKRAIVFIDTRFQILTQLLSFVSVHEIFKNLTPVLLFLGAGIGFLGSMLSVRKNLHV